LDFITAFGLDKTTTEAERLRFIEVAHTYRLDPFRKEIHALPANGNRPFTLMVGFEAVVRRAELTGQVSGWRAWAENSGPELKAIVEIHRRDWAYPYVHEVYFDEVAPRSAEGTLPTFWERMPRHQVKKTAIAQAFRLCFADELSGLPYEPSELGIDLVASPTQEPNPTPGHQAVPQRTQYGPTPPPARGSVGSPTPATLQPLRDQLMALMDQHPEAFDAKHKAWTLTRFDSATAPDGQQRMVAYVKKTIRLAPTSRRTEEPVF